MVCVEKNDFFDSNTGRFGFILDSIYANSLYAIFIRDVSFAYNEVRLYLVFNDVT